MLKYKDIKPKHQALSTHFVVALFHFYFYLLFKFFFISCFYFCTFFCALLLHLLNMLVEKWTFKVDSLLQQEPTK